MKTFTLMCLFFALTLNFCSQSNEPTDASENNGMDRTIQLDLLKRVFQLEARYTWKHEELVYFKRTGDDLISWYTEEEMLAELQKEDCDLGLRRAGVLIIANSPTTAVEEMLSEFLVNDDDAIVQFNCACALAYRGKLDGLEMLTQCAIGELVLTSSSFERNSAALALLLLGHKLPQAYLDWQFADPLYVACN